eukprot:c1717_g1_i1.p1 GENE.c1717_g1_i1~~c1717_g1_i1.p1  ORF type:complete len:140 (+),score=49.79 c1717_g1_i1:47-421(+)
MAGLNRPPNTQPGGPSNVIGGYVPSAMGGMGGARPETLSNRGGTAMANWNQCQSAKLATVKFEAEDLPIDEAKVRQRILEAHGFVHDKDVTAVVGIVQSLLAHGTTAHTFSFTSGDAIVRVPKL